MLVYVPQEQSEVVVNTNLICFFYFQCNFNIDILDKEVDMDAITAEVIGPSGSVYLNFDVGPDGGKGTFQPDEVCTFYIFKLIIFIVLPNTI